MTGIPERRDAAYAQYDPSRTIIDLFVERARFRPQKTAVVQEGRSISYEELSQRASVMASSLAADGVGRGDRVAILSPRSIDNVAAQLAVLATGAAFSPLDTRNPTAHLLSVAGELAPAMVLSADPGLAAALAASGFRVRELDKMCDLPAVPLEALANEPARRVGACDPACIIFTSGTTGRPKGVVLPHRGICRLVRGQDYADLGSDQVILNIASPGFDVCLSQIYSALLNGGTLAVVPGCVPSLDTIASVIASTGTTLADLTVGLFNLMVEHRLDAMASLKQVICGGDVMSDAHARRFQAACPGIRLINAYGPAENSVTSLCYTLESSCRAGEGVPIGTPIAHDRAFVLDEDGRPVGAGQLGQLAVGGDGLALGYHNRPELTAARFVHVEFPDYSGRLYLTGDLARINEDGIFTFHGRVDRQVKINGHRVELDAVEHQLRHHAAIADAAALDVAYPDGARKLVAFIKPSVPDAGPDLVDSILGWARDTLPPQMVPARLQICAEFPLTASDKVDRKRLLLELDEASGPGNGDSVAGAAMQGTDAAAVARQVWAEVLGLSEVPDDRTFFDLGGSSLQLINAHAAMERLLGRTFDIVKLFEAPRIRDLALLLAGEVADPHQGQADMAHRASARKAALARARDRTRSGQ